MHQSFFKKVAGVTTLALAVIAGSTFISFATAARLTNSSVTLSNPVPDGTSKHTIRFTATTAATLRGIRIQYATTASTGPTKPAGLGLTGGSVTNVTMNSVGVTAAWTSAAPTFNNTNGTVTLTNSTGTAVSSGHVISIELSGIVNSSIGDCDAESSSDTCYSLITVASDTGLSSPVDDSVTTYTVIPAVTVTATVDPTLSVTVAGVSAANITTNDSGAVLTGASGVTSTATTIPFGSLNTTSAKVAQQSVAVTTNAGLGYSLYVKWDGSGIGGDTMRGATSANNIDGFNTGSLSWPASGSPTVAAWSQPNGTTPSVNTAWIGGRSNRVATFTGTSNSYAPILVDSTVGGSINGSLIHTQSTPDAGTTPSYVSYRVGANVFQAPDVYTSTLKYTVVGNF